jgi:hypothetical protein
MIRRRRPEGLPIPLLAWALGLVPGMALMFSWLMDESMPWFAWFGYCRAAFLLMLPVALISWVLCAASMREWWASRKAARRQHPRDSSGG